jgi:NADH-quinone oxidoreductase subunit N
VARRGEAATAIDDYRGLADRKPLLALVFTVLLFAQTGVPLTSGFFAKFGVIAASVEAEYYWLAAVAMVSAVVGAFVYLRLVVAMYMSEAPASETEEVEGGEVAVLPALSGGAITVPVATTVALALAVGVTLLVGFLPGLITTLSGDAVPALLAPLR